MKPYKLSVRAGVEEQYSIGPANVIFLDPEATYRVTVKAPENGEEFTLSPGGVVRLSPFEELRVSHNSASDQIVPLFVGYDTDAQTAQVSGNMEIIGGSSNTLNPPSIQQIIDPVKPRTIGTSYYSGVVAGLVTMVAPSANVNGVRVDFATARGYPSTEAAVLVNTVTPASARDGAIIVWGVENTAGNGQMKVASGLPVIIPPGHGLFGYTSASSYLSAVWEVL